MERPIQSLLALLGSCVLLSGCASQQSAKSDLEKALAIRGVATSNSPLEATLKVLVVADIISNELSMVRTATPPVSTLFVYGLTTNDSPASVLYTNCSPNVELGLDNLRLTSQGYRDRETKARAVLLWVRVTHLADTESILLAGWSAGPLAAATYKYTIVNSCGRWSVRRAELVLRS